MKLPGAGVVLLAGAALVVGGFAYDVMFAGIPYQDPTPAMTDRYEADRAIADRLMLAGVLVLTAGAIVMAVRRARRRG